MRSGTLLTEQHIFLPQDAAGEAGKPELLESPHGLE